MKRLILLGIVVGAVLVAGTTQVRADHRYRNRSGFSISLNLGGGSGINYSRGVYGAPYGHGYGYGSPYRSYSYGVPSSGFYNSYYSVPSYSVYGSPYSYGHSRCR
ncbi:MAG: hypothetical protein KDA96_23560 [Planctomycetaceae bacterium]|nr:hypothetical protein [Planctomycetaceae bacterium]